VSCSKFLNSIVGAQFLGGIVKGVRVAEGEWSQEEGREQKDVVREWPFIRARSHRLPRLLTVSNGKSGSIDGG
jgi:hypothetical protein